MECLALQEQQIPRFARDDGMSDLFRSLFATEG